MPKYTANYLTKIENLFKEGGYKIRYEKGNFKSGYCVLEDSKVIVINKFSSVDSKISFLLEVIKTLKIEEQILEEKSRIFYNELKQTEIKF